MGNIDYFCVIPIVLFLPFWSLITAILFNFQYIEGQGYLSEIILCSTERKPTRVS